MNNFIGQWSSYEYNSYGSMEDCQIVFSPDGSGYCRFINLVGEELLTFSWHILDNGRIVIRNKKSFLIQSNGLAVQDDESSVEDEEVGDISVAVEATPSGEEKQVLTTSLFIGNKFAFVSREQNN